VPNVLYKELSTCLVHANVIIEVKRNDLKTKYCLKTRSDAVSQCLHARHHCYLSANFHSRLAARCGIPIKWYWRPRSEDASSTKSPPKSKRLILQLPAVEAVRLNFDCLSNSNTPAMSNPRAACGPVKVLVRSYLGFHFSAVVGYCTSTNEEPVLILITLNRKFWCSGPQCHFITSVLRSAMVINVLTPQ